jgi:hypothetical protein
MIHNHQPETRWSPGQWTLVGLMVAILLSGGACKNEDDGSDQDLILVGALAAAFSPQNPGSCNFTFGSRNVPIQEVDVATNGSSNFPNGFTTLFKTWAAVKLPTVANGTTVAFNYAPWYVTGGNTFYLVYNESACPITNSSNADFNYTFPDLQNTRTPTNYTVSGNTITFNATGAGKSFIVVSAASGSGAGSSVTRTN